MGTKHVPEPMPYTKAGHLLNPLRSVILSPKTLVKRLGLAPGLKVLELGPGPGFFSPEAARAIGAGKLVLVDVQQEMLDMAQRRLADMGIGNVEYRKGNAVSLPVESEAFDVAFLVSMLGEVPDRSACLGEIHRVLKRNGLLSITEFKLGDPDFIPKREMLEMIRAAGFRVSAQYGRFSHYTVNCRKQNGTALPQGT